MLVVSNWKAYVADTKTAKSLVAAGKRSTAKRNKVQLVIAPPLPYLGLLTEGKRGTKKLSFGAQDMSLSAGGAATGEVTAAALAGVGATHVIIGHSERRAIGETDEQVLAKVTRALGSGLTPILCIGERQRDPDAQYLQFLRAQLAAVFAAIAPKDRGRIIVAYEPIWAIGKTAAIQPHDLHEMVLYIRKILNEYVPANETVILYGGSVEPTNIGALAAESQVQGFLVGRASTVPASYADLIKALS